MLPLTKKKKLLHIIQIIWKTWKKVRYTQFIFHDRHGDILKEYLEKQNRIKILVGKYFDVEVALDDRYIPTLSSYKNEN